VNTSRPEIKVYPDEQALAQAAAGQIVTLANLAIADHGRFALALAGGSTPRTLYTLLAAPEFASRVPWSHVHCFWGDERCVPADHPDSNYRLARESLLDHVPLPAANVHRIPSEQPPEQAAALYEQTLRTFFTGNTTPRFDLILLGMGEDGHTASLFPGATTLHEQQRWVAACYVDRLHAWRVTLTPVALNAAAHVIFLVTGISKAGRLQQVLTGPYQPDRLPAQVVRPTHGHLLWLVDRAAAHNLDRLTPDNRDASLMRPLHR